MTVFDNITAQLKYAETIAMGGDTSAYVELLDRVIAEARLFKHTAMLTDFGKQFKPAGEPVFDPDTPRQFAVDQKVRTTEGYIGYVAGHDKSGKAIVNIVLQACEYPEAHLTAIPDASVLEAMKH